MAWFKFTKDDISERLADIAGLGYAVAAADGDVTEKEIRVVAFSIWQFAKETVAMEQIEQHLLTAARAIEEQGLQNYVKSLGKNLNEPAQRRLFTMACLVAVADGHASPHEADVLVWIGKNLGMKEDDVRHILENDLK